MAHHQRLAVAMGLDGAVEEGADRLADQLLGRDAMVVRDFGSSVSNRHAESLAGRGRFEIMKLDFVTVDVFTDRQFGGNPLAVITDASGLSTEQMQSIAAEFNLAETTFVLPPKDPAHTAEGPHLHAQGRDAVRRPSQCRHRLRAGARRRLPWPQDHRRPAGVRGEGRPGAARPHARAGHCRCRAAGGAAEAGAGRRARARDRGRDLSASTPATSRRARTGRSSPRAATISSSPR